MASESASLPPLNTSQPTSQTSSPRSSGPKTPLSLDLSDLPPLVTPSPPSNTLLITNLDDPAIFHAENLQTIRSLIDQHASIHMWCPLKSFRRIIVVFLDVDAAKLIKQTLDGEMIFDCRIRVYFGAHTELSSTDQHLQAPKSDKLFFISPPPSPPHGWEIRNEEPPNKEVHAEDLAHALARLHAHKEVLASPDYSEEDRIGETAGGRKRSGSVIVYHPGHHGDSPNLPAISVEDTTDSPQDVSPIETSPGASIVPTMRPPVELMDIE